MRLSKAPRKVFPHRDVAALREILREAAAKGRPDGSAAVPPDPRRDRRRVLDGRRHRAAARASSRRPRRSARPSTSTTRTPRACSGATVAARSTTSGSTAGSTIQVGTMSKAMGVLGGYVAGSRPCASSSIQRARPFLFSTSHPPADAAACREAIRVMQDEPWRSSACGRARSASRPS